MLKQELNMIKTFKQYNESVKDLLIGKSDEDVKKGLDNLPNNKKIETIIKYQLDYSLLPRNSEGICTYYGHLDCSFNKLTSLPDNLTVNGHLYCYDNLLTSLPDNLIVNGFLNCMFNQLNSLPENLVVEGNLYCGNNPLPKNIEKPKGVKGKLIL